MFGLLIVLTVILVLILINKNTKSSPEGMGCVQQGCLWVFALLAFAMWVSNQQAQLEVERRQIQRSEQVAPAPQVMFTEVTMADASNPSVHKTSYDCSTTKIVVNCRVIGATPGTPLTGKWFLLGSGTKQLLQMQPPMQPAQAIQHSSLRQDQAISFGPQEPMRSSFGLMASSAKP